MKLLRSAARTVRRTLRTCNTRVLRKCGLLRADWAAELPAEATFWENALRENGRNWSPGEFERRTDPMRELQPELRRLISAPEGATVRILDVGAGPLTTLGKCWPGRTVEITAIDPLAVTYDALLARLQIHPPVRTQVGHGEKLLEQFYENAFDMAYASNALDHSYNPLASIRQMYTVTKPLHYIYLWHFANEGATEHYCGLHQWNFDTQKDDFIISDGRTRNSLRAEFGSNIELSCEEQFAYGKRVVIAKIKKIQR